MDFFWLIPNKLAGGSLPKTSMDIAYLQQKNIHHIVSLVGHIYKIQELITNTGIEIHHIPIPDWGVPSKSQIQQFLELTSKILNDEEAIYVHCYGGCGRTGTMLALYLISSGINGKEALEKIRSIRPCSVETEEQEKLVLEF